MAYAVALDPLIPANTDLVELGAGNIRDTKSAIIERLETFFTDVDVDPLLIRNTLALSFASLILSGGAAVGTSLSVGTTTLLTGDVTIGASKVVVTAASGNTAIQGALGVVGNFTVNLTKLTVDAATGELVGTATANFTGANGLAIGGLAGRRRLQSSSSSAFSLLSDADAAADLTVAALTTTTINASGAITGSLTGNVTGNLTGNVTGNVTGSSGSTTGNAATATILQTTRTINGTNFNGSANITIGVAAADVTGTTLAASVVNASINNLAGGLTTAGNIVATGADVTAGGTVQGTSVIGTSAVQGATFRTTVGSTSCPNNTATTIFAALAYSSYWIYAYDATGTITVVVAIVTNSTGQGVGTFNLSGNGITVGFSGLNVQLTQATGSSKTLSWVAVRIV